MFKKRCCNSANKNNSPEEVYAITGGADYKSNVLQSTTGNVYGIYDMSGGAYEYVVGLIRNKLLKESKHVGILVNDNIESIKKYKIEYAFNKLVDNNQANYDMQSNKIRLGEAIHETSNYGNYSTSWNKDYSDFADDKWACIIRGGNFNSATDEGIIAFNSDVGCATDFSSFSLIKNDILYI